MIQIRAEYNHPPVPEVEAFIEKWKQDVLAYKDVPALYQKSC